jgi:hypothetical protein
VSAARTALAAALLSGLLGAFGHHAAAAESRLRVLIVIDESDDPFAERIRAEVSALGLEVVAVEPWRTGEPVESLEAVGRANQAAAAIRMVASRKGVEVWVANQPTGRSLLRQLIVDERPGTPNEGLVALQTAELLRTTLLSRSEVPARPAPPPRAPPPPTAPPQITASPPPPAIAGLQAGAGALFSPGAGDPSMQLWISVNRIVAGPIGLALDVSAPLRAGTLSGPEGSARIDAWLGGAALFLRHERPEKGLYGSAAAGVAAIRLNAAGSTSAPLIASTQSATAAAVYARADGGIDVTRWLRLGLRLAAGVVPSGIDVKFAGNEAGTWGRPFLAGLVLLDLAWR